MLEVATVVTAACAIACDGGPTSLRMPRTVTVSVDNASGLAVALSADSVTLLSATGIRLRATAVGTDGKPLAGGTPAWRSTNPDVAIVAPSLDAGQVRGESSVTIATSAPGTALVIASIGGVADTVAVTVIPFLDATHGFTFPAQPARFDMSVRVHGFVRQPGDASTRVLEPLAGALVNLTLLPPREGDRIPPGAETIASPTLVATSRTDAAGLVWFRNLPTSRYRLEILPPQASAWRPIGGEAAPPTLGFVHNEIWLHRP